MIRWRVTDKDGGETTGIERFHVANTAPQVDSFTEQTVATPTARAFAALAATAASTRPPVVTNTGTVRLTGTFSDLGADTESFRGIATIRQLTAKNGSVAAPVTVPLLVTAPVSNAAGTFALAYALPSAGTYSVTATVTDSQGASADSTLTVIALDMALSHATIPEKAGPNAFVGTLSLTPDDPSAVYELVSGDGDFDNAKFKISNNKLQAINSFDYEASGGMSVRIRATSSNGDSVERVFTVGVSDVNEPVTAVAFDNAVTRLSENKVTTSGVKLADVRVIDDALGSRSVSVSGAGAASFEIRNGSNGPELWLKSGTRLDFLSKPSLSVNVVVVDDAFPAQPVQATFSLAVTRSGNQSPSVTSSGTATAAENQTAVQTVTGSDPDASTTLKYSIAGGADSAKFTIDSNTGVLTFRSAPNYESPTDAGADNVYNVTVRVSDGSLTATKDVAVTVTNVNEAPVALALINQVTSLTENTSTAARIKVADIVVTDDALGTNTFNLSGADASSFEIDVTSLYLKAGVTLNFEAKSTYVVSVTGSDVSVDGSVSVTTPYTLAVTNVPEQMAAPKVSLPASFAVLEDTASPLVFVGVPVTDADSPVTKVIALRFAVTDGTISGTPDAGIAIAGTGTARTFTGTITALNTYLTAVPAKISYKPVLNSNALRTLTVTASEAYRTKVLTSSQTAMLTIITVNDAPTVIAPASFTVTEDVATKLVWPANSIPFADVDSPVLTVTLSVADGTITAAPAEGITIGGTPTARTISGATALVNNYFKRPGKLAYMTAPDNTVSRTLITMVSDGTLSMTKISTIRIISVNDAPQILASAVVAGRNGGSGVELRYDVLKAASGASDIDSPSLALVVQSVRSGLLQRWNGTAWVRISATSPIALRTLLPGQKLRWIPPATAAGTLEAFTLKASDGRLVSSTTCTVSVSLSGPT